MTRRSISLSEDESRVFGMAIEFYIRLGLGQFGEIAQRLDLLQGRRVDPDALERIRRMCEEMEDVAWGGGKPWSLHDDEASRYTLTAFRLESRLAGKAKAVRWADRRIRRLAEEETLDPRE